MSKGQIVFISLMDIKRMPSYIEREMLENMQSELRHNYWIMENEIKSKYDKAVFKQFIHKKYRESIKLVE